MYIKSFKVFESVESEFSDKINYNLIYDLRDRSLDLIVNICSSKIIG